MTDQDLSADPVAVAKRARDDIEAVRRKLQSLCAQLAVNNDTAKELARNALCKALVERLELADREALELIELIVATQTSP